VDAFTAWWLAFLAGVYAPLGSPCILPLYPGFIAFLAGQSQERETRQGGTFALGLVVSAGVILSMLTFGAIYVAVVQISLSRFLGIISPVAFLILAAFSVALIFDLDPSRFIPARLTPSSGRPYRDAFFLGLFFGVVILPCNAAAVVALLALGTAVTGLLVNLATFLWFGIGMSLPLLLFAGLAVPRGRQVTSLLARYRRPIHVAAGLVMLAVSLYYLLLVYFPVTTLL
jgi:cytochrome c-type biogenesis protein